MDTTVGAFAGPVLLLWLSRAFGWLGFAVSFGRAVVYAVTTYLWSQG